MNMNMRAITYFVKVFYVFLLYLVVSNADEECKKVEKPNSMKIKELVLCDYDKTNPPVLKENDPIVISLRLLFYHFDFFERRNIIRLKGWGLSKWRDEHVQWEPQDYNNSTIVFISPTDVWMPDLFVLNAKNKYNSKFMQGGVCAMHYEKMVYCAFPIKLSGFCKADFTYWPFDTHNCTIRIESLYHKGDKIDFNSTETGLDSIDKLQTKWEIIDYDSNRSPGGPKCCPNMSYPTMKFNFIVKRHITANVVFLLIPFIVLSLCTILALGLNAEAPERIYIAAFNISFHTYYLLNSTWELPTFSDFVPKLILLLRNSQMLATLVIIETITIRYLLNKCGDCPRRLIYFISVFTKSTFGQLFLYPELYSNNSVSVAVTNEDDGENLVDKQSKINNWKLFGIFLDRFFFFFIIIVYIVMFVNCIPK